MTTLFIKKHLRKKPVDNHFLKFKLRYKKTELCRTGIELKGIWGCLGFFIVKLQMGPDDL